jgi:hypothetical protein
VVSEKKLEMWKVYRRQTTDDGRQVMAIVHMDLWSKWTKNYIYKCKLNEAKPNTIELKNKIKKYQSFDQYIAKKKNTVQAYEKFWAPIYNILN